MWVSVEVLCVVIALISLPNLFHRAEFDVPLLLFAAAIWHRAKSTCVYLILFSILMSLYRVILLIPTYDQELAEQRKPLFLVCTILAFVCKIALLVYAVITDPEVKIALSPGGMVGNIAKSFSGSDQ